MAEERNRIKGKSKVITHYPEGILPFDALGMVSNRPLVIKEGGQAIDIEEAVKRLEAANEHQIKAGTLLDFTVKVKEPERKKRKYKRKVPANEIEQSKKTR
ncbi:hypothetical protein MKW98_021369, partial [Papaver atlanticum]